MFSNVNIERIISHELNVSVMKIFSCDWKEPFTNKASKVYTKSILGECVFPLQSAYNYFAERTFFVQLIARKTLTRSIQNIWAMRRESLTIEGRLEGVEVRCGSQTDRESPSRRALSNT